MLFEKRSDILVCMDSDGTVMDTMTVKHVNCFGPAFLDVFQIADHRDEILEEWNRTNLYSKKRGINRFQGLDEILRYVRRFGYEFAGCDRFSSWVKTTSEFSVDSLKREIALQSDTACLMMAVRWSDEVNRRIRALPPAEIFPEAAQTVKEFADRVDFIGVSSANKEAVYEEWKASGIFDDCRWVACQDVGKKNVIIASALAQGYRKENTVMLGDALGDIAAAAQNGVRFFPIVPGKERASWETFRKEGILRLIEGTFDQEYQDQLIQEFEDSLL